MWLADYGLFVLKLMTVLSLSVLAIAGIAKLSTRGPDGGKKGRLQVTDLNDHYTDLHTTLAQVALDKKAHKTWQKEQKSALKKRTTPKKRLFILTFKGDVQASAVQALREEINAILQLANKNDEVVLILSSGGGVVHQYGLAASQLERLRDRRIPLTVIIDQIAASGGYLMASVAQKILCAPFAIVGSIGVIMQLPNLHRLLDDKKIDIEQLTAGQYKRTLTLLGKNTADRREKAQADIDHIHTLFKQHVHSFRPQLEMDRVSTGEYWFGRDALDLGLVDGLTTSDDYLMSAQSDAQLVQVRFVSKKRLGEKLGLNVQQAMQALLNAWQMPPSP